MVEYLYVTPFLSKRSPSSCLNRSGSVVSHSISYAVPNAKCVSSSSSFTPSQLYTFRTFLNPPKHTKCWHLYSFIICCSNLQSVLTRCVGSATHALASATSMSSSTCHVSKLNPKLKPLYTLTMKLQEPLKLTRKPCNHGIQRLDYVW